MTKRLLSIIFLLLLLPLLTVAQEESEEADKIPYLRLNSNFSVLELPDWDVRVVDETVLFVREDIQAQIYVRIVDTLDAEAAIETALADVELISAASSEAVVDGQIGRNNGTWIYRIFSEAETSVTAYALLKSEQVYVVLFAEESPEYDAYHLAVRATIVDPTTDDEINEVISTASLNTIYLLRGFDIVGDAITSQAPDESNPRWIESRYENDISTAAYFPENETIVYVTMVEGDAELTRQLSNAFDTVFLGFVITPNNSEFLALGLTLATVIMLGLIGSMYLRYQNLKKDMLVLEQLAEEA